MLKRLNAILAISSRREVYRREINVSKYIIGVVMIEAEENANIKYRNLWQYIKYDYSVPVSAKM